MASLKLYFDTRNESKDGLYPIKLIIQNKGNALINLNIKVGLDQLIENKQLTAGYEIVNHPQKKFYNNYIESRFIQVKSLLFSLENSGEIKNMTASQIKKLIEGKEEVEKKTLVKDHFMQFIETKNKPRTKQIYLDTYKKIERFADFDSLLFEDVNYKWVKSFEAYLLETNAINTVAISLRNLRAVFNDAIDEDIVSLNLYPFRKFKIKSEPTKKRSLTIEQLREFMNLECEPYQKRYIDMFMLIFYLIGINLVDLTHLKKIDNGYIEYTRAKTSKPYSIKLEPEALEIIDRYKGKNYLINILDRYTDHKTFTGKINAQLKKIGNVFTDNKGNKIVKPLFPYLTTYYARHTWATIAASLDIPKETIAAALGHGGNTVTDIYINFDQKKIDQANRKVIDYVMGRK